MIASPFGGRGLAGPVLAGSALRSSASLALRASVVALALGFGSSAVLAVAPDATRTRDAVVAPERGEVAGDDVEWPSGRADAGDPSRDGWASEAFHDRSRGVLDRLVAWMGAEERDPGAFAAWFDPDVEATGFARTRSKRARHGAGIDVERRRGAGRRAARGVDSVRRAFLEWLAPFEGGPRVELKVVTVALGPAPSTVVEAHVVGADARDAAIERTARWTIGWVPGDGDPRIREIAVSDEETVVSARGPLFAEVTAAALAPVADKASLTDVGVDTLWGHVDRSRELDALGHQGLAVGDVDGDGRDDVYFATTGGVPNRLFRQRSDGTVEDVAAHAGVDWLDRTSGALFVDLDGDADQDLVVVLPAAVRVLANDGTGRFETRARIEEVRGGFGLAAADYDRDGDLDLFVTRYYPDGEYGEIQTPVPYHDAENGGANVLLRNEGDWTFRDVTAEVGLDDGNRRFTFGATFEDYDDDGDVDLYVVNDFGRNRLFRNDSGAFVDVAAEAGVEDIAAGMAATWSDYDLDGDLDLYVANMFSSAGGRITTQPRFQAGATDEARAAFRRHARGNSLFENLGDGRFDDVSEKAGVTIGRWAWGTRFLDVDHDARDDLVVLNGYVSSEDTGDL